MMSEERWKSLPTKYMAVKEVENKKQTKRMKKQLEEFDRENAEELGIPCLLDYPEEEQQVVRIRQDNLKRLVELLKGAKAEVAKLHVRDDYPLHVELEHKKDDSTMEERGEAVIAPVIID